jgi:hypothetical protein
MLGHIVGDRKVARRLSKDKQKNLGRCPIDSKG